MEWSAKWLSRFREGLLVFLRSFPSTNGRIVATILESFAFVGSMCFAILNGIAVDPALVYAVGLFLLVKLGLDGRQFAKKRDTHSTLSPQNTDG